jgi:hypothetical protein
MRNRLIWAVLGLIMGGLQAWDSGVLRAGSAIQLLTAVGLVIPALALVTTARWTIWVIALVIGAALMTWARIASPISLNALHISLIVPAMYVFFVSRWEEMAATRQA